MSILEQFKLDGQVAVITGGASGVGRSLAFALGRRGARIVVGDVDKPAMEKGIGCLRKRVFYAEQVRPASMSCSFVLRLPRLGVSPRPGLWGSTSA